MSQGKLRKLVMVGGFSTKGKFLGGESVKNNLVAREFSRRGARVITVDTAGWRGRPAQVATELLRAIGRGRCTVMLCSAAPGARLALPFLVSLTRLLRFRLVYLVVGYGILDFARRQRWLRTALRQVDQIYLETEGMRLDLASLGIHNGVQIPNLRPRIDTNHRTSIYNPGAGLQTVFMSRIVRSKGADTAIAAVAAYNSLGCLPPLSMDVWGTCSPEDRRWLDPMLEGDPRITYKGPLANEDVCPTLANYHFMVFPSRYEGEVFPGAVLEAHAVGLPVLISDWHYNAECVEDGKTGFVLPVLDVDAWVRKFVELGQMSSDAYAAMSTAATESLSRYVPEIVMERLWNQVFG